MSNNKPDLKHLIRLSYSLQEVARHGNCRVEQRALNDIVALGKEILTHVPPMPGACTLMSALWTARVRDKLNLPAFCVAGDLLIGEQIIWGDRASTTENVAAVFQGIKLDWEGHCWMYVGDYLADASIFRTAYSVHSPPLLNRFIVERFGRGRGMWLGTQEGVDASGLVYVPKHVLTESQVNGVIAGLAQFHGIHR
jgi:hypothetical protein